MKGFLKKIDRILLFIFLLLIPTQLGRHFWPDWSYVLGIRVDYLSPTLYLVDVVWFLWFGVESILILKNKTPQSPDVHRGTAPLEKREPLISFKNFLILGFVGINILVATSPMVALYKWLRIGQAAITFFYLKKNKKLVKENLIKIIPCWITLESLLAMAQMAKNGSLNGIFYWLGERSFTFNTIGIAQVSLLGRGLIRAYGTFSHPNSLAGFLLVSLLLWWWLKPLSFLNPPALRAPSLEKGGLKELKPLCPPMDIGRHLPLTKGEVFYFNILWWVVTWLGLLGILVSGSRTIWILTGGLILALAWKKLENKWNIIGLTLIFLGMVVFGLRMVDKEYWVGDFLGGWDSNGLEKRVNLNIAGLKMMKESPWFGVGLGNFLVRLPEFQKNNGIYWLQPAHNILILALSEVGILGLFLGWLMFNKNIVWRKLDLVFKIILGVILISGMVDHYWLTLPQNIWLLVVVLAIV